MTGGRPWLAGLVLALLVAGLLSPWASSWPDGLERVADGLGFHRYERETPVVAAPLPDYRVAALSDERWSTAAAGVVGTLVVFGAAAILGFALRRRS